MVSATGAETSPDFTSEDKMLDILRWAWSTGAETSGAGGGRVATGSSLGTGADE